MRGFLVVSIRLHVYTCNKNQNCKYTCRIIYLGLYSERNKGGSMWVLLCKSFWSVHVIVDLRRNPMLVIYWIKNCSCDVKIRIHEKHVLFQTSAEFFFIDVWSSPFTWGGGPLPKQDDLVVITPGQTILLDVSPPKLRLLLIQGVNDASRKIYSFSALDLRLNSSNNLVYR